MSAVAEQRLVIVSCTTRGDRAAVRFAGIDGDIWDYVISAEHTREAAAQVCTVGEITDYLVTSAIIDLAEAAPGWLKQTGIFSFYGTGRAAIREAIKTTLTAFLRK